MGFFKSLFDEAGKKTGSAIGNKLFPNSTDYIRLGELGGDPEERLAAEQNAYIERLEMEQQKELMFELMKLHFDTKDLEHNINVLTQIAAILDSLPAWVYRSDLEHKIYKMAKSKMESGIAMCKSIDPNNQMITFFENKY
jgi:hypothetical protein